MGRLGGGGVNPELPHAFNHKIGSSEYIDLARKSKGRASFRGSVLVAAQLQRYSGCRTDLDGIEEECNAAAIVVTDVVGSTAMWCKDDLGMVERILRQNARFRRVLDAFNLVKHDTTLLKVNEIGDSWVVAVQGPACCTLAQRFAQELQRQTELPLRIGVHYGTFTIVRLNRYDSNGFLPLQYECFGLTRSVLNEVKELEQGSTVGGVQCSCVLNERMKREESVPSSRDVVTKALSMRHGNGVVPVLLEGYVLFVTVNEGRVRFLEQMCQWGRQTIVNTHVKVVSLEDEGQTWSLFGHTAEAVRSWLQWAGGVFDLEHTKISVVHSTRVWQIHDVSDDPYQHYERYVSHAQNIAARIGHIKGGWGEVRSDFRETLTMLVPDADTFEFSGGGLKGLGKTRVFSAPLTRPLFATRDKLVQAQCVCVIS